MNAHRMLDHALGQLEGPAREQAEAELAADPELAETIDRLVRAIHRLLDDGRTIEPPPDLASRTLAFVVRESPQAASTPRLRAGDRPVPLGGHRGGRRHPSSPACSPWCRPSSGREDRMNQAACVFNLQQLGLGLAQYGHRTTVYPYGSPRRPQARPGRSRPCSTTPGCSMTSAILDCPCNGACQHTPLPEPRPSAGSRPTTPAVTSDCSAGITPTTAVIASGAGPARPLSTPCSDEISRCSPTSRRTPG